MAPVHRKTLANAKRLSRTTLRTPSVLFDAVAVILSIEGAKALSMESAAIDFVRDAFGHLKAIAVDEGGQSLLKTANR